MMKTDERDAAPLPIMVAEAQGGRGKSSIDWIALLAEDPSAIQKPSRGPEADKAKPAKPWSSRTRRRRK